MNRRSITIASSAVLVLAPVAAPGTANAFPSQPGAAGVAAQAARGTLRVSLTGLTCADKAKFWVRSMTDRSKRWRMYVANNDTTARQFPFDHYHVRAVMRGCYDGRYGAADRIKAISVREGHISRLGFHYSLITPATKGAVGAVTQVDTSSAGVSTNSYGNDPVWSPDGRMIAFRSPGSNLVAGDTNGCDDVFVKTIATGITTRITRSTTGGQSSCESVTESAVHTFPAWSPDSEKLAFSSYASNLVANDTNGDADLFVADLASGTITRVSTNGAGQQATGAGVVGSQQGSWSPDGTQVAFFSMANNLIAGDTNGVADIFVKSLVTGSVRRISTTTSGSQSVSTVGGITPGSYTPIWSPDGTALSFMSNAHNLVPGDTNGTEDTFVKDLATGAIERISISASGGQANGSSGAGAWSPDGRKIAFSSRASNLVPGDADDSDNDVFIKNLTTGAITRIGRAVTTSEQNPKGDTTAPAWSPDGTRLMFLTAASSLVPLDCNGSKDVYIVDLATGSQTRVTTNASGEQAGRYTGGTGYFDGAPAIWSPDGKKIVFETAPVNFELITTTDLKHVVMKSLPPGLQ